MKVIELICSFPAVFKAAILNGIDVDRRAQRLACVLELSPAERDQIIERAHDLVRDRLGASTADILDGMYELACGGATTEQLLHADYEWLWKVHYHARLGIRPIRLASDPAAAAEHDLGIPR